MRPTLSTLGHFLVSLAIRFLFSVFLAAGIACCALTYQAWRSNYWEGDPNQPRIAAFMSIIMVLAGFLGTFRRRRREDETLGQVLIAGAAVSAGAAVGHVHVPGHSKGPELEGMRRWPDLELIIIGAATMLPIAVFGDHVATRATLLVGTLETAFGAFLWLRARKRQAPAGASTSERIETLQEASTPSGPNTAHHASTADAEPRAAGIDQSQVY